MSPETFLLIVKGSPFAVGQRIPLTNGKCLLGRAYSDQDSTCIHFDNPYVSRRHAVLSIADDRVTIEDPGSRHGTSINGEPLPAGEERALGDGDTIDFASGSVQIRFCRDTCMDATMEYRPADATPAGTSLAIDVDKRECRLDDRVISLIGKEFDFIALLYGELGKVVPYDTIKAAIWPERVIDGVPDVSNGEVNALAYRLRKKLGKGGEAFAAVPRAGYIMKSE